MYPATRKGQNKKKRKRVGRACVFCQRSHMSCDEGRPCKRCVARGTADLCKDGKRKRRGRKKRGTGSDDDSDGESYSSDEIDVMDSFKLTNSSEHLPSPGMMETPIVHSKSMSDMQHDQRNNYLRVETGKRMKLGDQETDSETASPLSDFDMVADQPMLSGPMRSTKPTIKFPSESIPIPGQFGTGFQGENDSPRFFPGESGDFNLFPGFLASDLYPALGTPGNWNSPNMGPTMNGTYSSPSEFNNSFNQRGETVMSSTPHMSSSFDPHSLGTTPHFPSSFERQFAMGSFHGGGDMNDADF